MNRPKRSYGQHFLVNPGAADAIVDALGAAPGDDVLEIGPGRGVLTERLMRTGARVRAIEADADLEPLLREKFPALDLHMADATRLDFAFLGDGPVLLVSNLPYNVSKPLLTRFYADRKRFSRWVLMMQRELAERLLASPGTKDWGPLTVMLRNVTDIERLIDLGPNSFRPPPRVDSTVLRFTVRETPLCDLGGDEAAFNDMMFELFRERRKTLQNRLKSLQLPQEILTQHGLTGRERIEILPLERLVALVRDLVASRTPRV
jgi:16S rRNA (adenine1518-N6/adenine1519-N6)-dimethyltransferase